MKIKIINNKKTATSMDIKSEIFAVALNQNLLAQVVRAQQANHRRAIAHTKTRGEVSGGGRKPFKQKGTGLVAGLLLVLEMLEILANDCPKKCFKKQYLWHFPKRSKTISLLSLKL